MSNIFSLEGWEKGYKAGEEDERKKWQHRIDDAFHRGMSMADLLAKVYEEGKTAGTQQEARTNQDKLQSMNTWELAEWIWKVSEHKTEISTCEELCDDCERSEGWCVSMIAEWLQKGIKE